MIFASAKDFDGWRQHARILLGDNVDPRHVVWEEGNSGQTVLFETQQPTRVGIKTVPIPPDFLKFIQRISLHSSGEKWSLLYSALWRVTRGEQHLLRILTDPLVDRLMKMDKEIRRDAHKTKAFVRFRRVGHGQDEQYIAWHCPDHRILPLVAPFFKRRFAVMQWSVLTPHASVAWDGAHLRYGPGVAAGTVTEDSTEELWLTYYASTFNPARIKIKMMKKEMPVRHWPTLPETSLIPRLLRDASRRVDHMTSTYEGSSRTAVDYIPLARTYESLHHAALSCRGCDLHLCATQTVFGKGPSDAKIMLVGEQPGENEDRHGQSFIGPSGQILDELLLSLGLDRSALYVTNTVKHFKFVQRGKRRIHQTPNAREINSCKPWLFSEIELIKPEVIVTLGTTAGRALIHQGFSLKHDGQQTHLFQTVPVVPTWHPSAVLRAPDAALQDAIREHMRRALAKASQHVMKSQAAVIGQVNV